MPHPDEGTIHAWLDGALAPADARAFEEHVASCAECAAAVADARGVLAAASRILSALDNVPAGIIPATTTDASATTERGGQPRWRFRAARWQAAAAILIVAGASWAVLERSPGGTTAAKQVATQRAAADTVGESMTMDSVSVALPERSERNAMGTSSMPIRDAKAAAPIAEDKATAPMRVARTRQTAGVGAGPPSQQSTRSAENAARAVPDNGLLRSRVGASAEVAIAQQAESDTRDAPSIVDAVSARIDSVLAADSARGASGYAVLEERAAAMSKKARGTADAAQAPAPAASGLRAATAPYDRAPGCYALVVSAWSPGNERPSAATALLPTRIELRRVAGVSGDEQGNRLARPAPGEPPLNPGAIGFWKSLGDGHIRVTFADGSSWIVLTLAVDPDAVHGPARAWSATTGRLQSAEVAGQRTTCRREP